MWSRPHEVPSPWVRAFSVTMVKPKQCVKQIALRSMGRIFPTKQVRGRGRGEEHGT